MNDEGERHKYDLVYPSIKQKRPSASTPQSEAFSEEVQIAAIQKSKQERSVRWQATKRAFDSSIFELQRVIRQLDQDIRNLDSILAAEVLADAQKNSWATWLLSPLYKTAEESEEQKARTDRGRQERRIEKDLKERRLEGKRVDLKREEARLTKAKEENEAAGLSDERKIGIIQAKRWAREAQERQERDKVERERLARILRQQQEELAKQWEKQRREAEEARKKVEEERRAAEQKRRDEEQKRQDEEQKRWEQYLSSTSTSSCSHGGWWLEVVGRAACPECHDVWHYLLQCPGCKMKACPKCKAAIRPRMRQGRYQYSSRG